MKLRCLAVVGVFAGLALAQVGRADWTLVTGDFAEKKGLTVNTWDVSEGLSVTEGGKLVKVNSRNVLGLTSGRPAAATVGGGAVWRMSLRNGDVLYGEPAAVSGQSLEFKVAEMGLVAVPLKLVAAIVAVKRAEPGVVASGGGPVTQAAGAADKDVVRLKNGDTVEGLVVNVDGQKLEIAVGAGDSAATDIEMARVEWLSFGGVTPPRNVPPLSARLTFISGSVLTVPLDAKQKSFSWTINEITFKDPAGQERKTTGDAIARLDVTGGRVVCLTELDPAKDEQTTYMGTQWATQVNRNVLGQPLKVGKQSYARGLGVHTRSHLLYELDGSFETLKLRVGMDDSAAPQGMADVSVMLDGKVLWEAKGLKAGGGAGQQVSEELALPIKGGKRLELRADPGLGAGKIDVLGRVDWLNVALVRP